MVARRFSAHLSLPGNPGVPGIVGLRGTRAKTSGLSACQCGHTKAGALYGSVPLWSHRSVPSKDLVTIPGLGFSSERRSIGMKVEIHLVSRLDHALEPWAV